MFSGEGEGSNTVKVEIVRKVDEKEVIIWEQELFTQPEVSSLDSTTQRELLEKYAPIVVYSSDEEYAPMKIEDIFEQIKDTSCTKIKFKSSVGTQNVDINNLSEYMAYNGNSNYLLDWNDALFNSGSKSFKNIKGDFDNSTIYTWFQHEDDKYYLTYYFIYGYDPKTAFGAGNHNLDRESMTVVLNDNFEPESVITGGHLDKSTIFFTDEKYKEIFSWTHERVKTDYELMTSDFSQGHPVVYIEKGQHCVMPLSGYYKNMTSGMTSKNHAGIIQNIYSKENIIVNNIKAIFPESFNTQSDIKIYTTEKMKIDSMYGNNILNFSGYWGDVLGTTNAKFPPFLNRDTDKKTWYVNATEFNTSNINKPNYTRRTEEQFENGYLFSLSNIENISYSVAGDLINVTWDSLDGASGYEVCIYSNGEVIPNTITESNYCTLTRTSSFDEIRVRAFYFSDQTVYGSKGTIKIYSNYAVANEGNTNANIIINVRDALTNEKSNNVDIWVDNILIGKTQNSDYPISIISDIQHTVRTHKDGYIDVEYNEIIVPEGETIYLETLMQVPYSANYECGEATLILKNALNGDVLPNTEFVIRKGMNTTTGNILKAVQSDSFGKIILDKVAPGNYTGVIDKDGYIKTVFNFIILGSENKSYEVHVSPIISKDEIRIVLSWEENPRDLDSHLSGNNLHVYYSNKVETGVSLDKDDTDGYGPETITINTSLLRPGNYTYYVHRYAGSGTISNSKAIVKVYIGNSLFKTYYADQSGAASDYWYIFNYNTITGSIISI